MKHAADSNRLAILHNRTSTTIFLMPHKGKYDGCKPCPQCCLFQSTSLRHKDAYPLKLKELSKSNYKIVIRIKGLQQPYSINNGKQK